VNPSSKSHLFPNEIWPDNWFEELDASELFPDSSSPIEIDLGCGDGGFLHQMGQQFPDRNFIGIERLLPDPWPKAKHHKRRLMCQASFFRHVHTMLETDGEFLFKTDHQEYFDAAMEDRAWTGQFEHLEWSDDAFYYPITDFETMWREQGRSFYRIRLKRISSPER